jgi:hypothetical protein
MAVSVFLDHDVRDHSLVRFCDAKPGKTKSFAPVITP